MAINMQELMDRVAALEIEALNSISVAVDAVDRFFYTQGSYPYFVNRLGTIAVDDDGEDLDVYVVEVRMRLIIGHLTEGYDGEIENVLQQYIPVVIEWFNERELLQSAAYPLALDDLDGGARVTGCLGFAVFQQSGIGTAQVGTEFTLRCPFREYIEQAYL